LKLCRACLLTKEPACTLPELTAKVGRVTRSLSHFAAQHAGGLTRRRNFERPEKRFKNGAGWAPGPVRVGQKQAEENDLFCGWSAGGRGLPFI